MHHRSAPDRSASRPRGRARPVQRPPGRQIQGPQSALTDFLASQNINSNRILRDADARRAAALASQQAAAANGEEESSAPEQAEPVRATPRRNETKAQEKKRKHEEEKSIAKIKASKQSKRRMIDTNESDEDDVEGDFSEQTQRARPGELRNCEICEVRFTVTAYCRTGPTGGLLCAKCSKELDMEESAKKKRKTPANRMRRREKESQRLDGTLKTGAKSLLTLCIETLAKNVELAEDLGDLPPKLVNKLSAILSKNRLITSKVLDLFLKSNTDTITIYDGAKLTSDDYMRILQLTPRLKHLRLRNAIQFKNHVMDYLISTPHLKLETFDILGANLIDDDHWDEFLRVKGMYLRSLKVYWTDGHFGDEQLAFLPSTCPDLKRLKVCHNQKVTDAGISSLAGLTKLEHLSLEIYQATTSAPYVSVLERIGANLQTFSAATVAHLDDTVLAALHANCMQLQKLRLTENETFSDAGFASLFEGWSNPPLRFVDLHACRHLEHTAPRENPDGIGLCSKGFEALMGHSGASLRRLDIHSCRHISLECFERVFSLGSNYPELEEMDLSFCTEITDLVVGLIWKACPSLKRLVIFGCFGVRQVRVPRGRILIGMPNVVGMEIEGVEEE
jgi:DNA repair protein RAD7